MLRWAECRGEEVGGAGGTAAPKQGATGDELRCYRSRAARSGWFQRQLSCTQRCAEVMWPHGCAARSAALGGAAMGSLLQGSAYEREQLSGEVSRKYSQAARALHWQESMEGVAGARSRPVTGKGPEAWGAAEQPGRWTAAPGRLLACSPAGHWRSRRCIGPHSSRLHAAAAAACHVSAALACLFRGASRHDRRVHPACRSHRGERLPPGLL